MPTVKLNDVRLFFPDLFEPREFKGKTRYRAVLAVEPGSANHKAIEAAILAAATEKFGAKAAKKVEEFRPVKQQFCYRNGDSVDYEGAEGKMVLTANRESSKGAPLVIDRNRQVLTARDGKPYSGCYVNAVVEIWALSGENSGVWATINGVQFNRDGESFAGGTRASVDDFDDLGDGADADDTDDLL